MAETSPHAHRPSPRPKCSRLHRLRTEARLLSHRLTALVFVGSGALLGADSFGLLMWLWPLYPTMVPLVLIGCGIAAAIVGAVTGSAPGGRRHAGTGLVAHDLRRGPRRPLP